MKPLLLEILRDQPDDFRRRSTVREYLQARILLALQDSSGMTWVGTLPIPLGRLRTWFC